MDTENMDFLDALNMEFRRNKNLCLRLITQCVKYTRNSEEIFKRSCDMLVIPKKFELYLRKYGYPYFSEAEQKSHEIDGHIKVLLNIDCKEIGRLNGSVNVFVDNSLGEDEILQFLIDGNIKNV